MVITKPFKPLENTENHNLSYNNTSPWGRRAKNNSFTFLTAITPFYKF